MSIMWDLYSCKHADHIGFIALKHVKKKKKKKKKTLNCVSTSSQMFKAREIRNFIQDDSAFN